MAQISFCCANSQGYLLDRRVAEVDDLLAARNYAKEFVWSFMKTAQLQDWRSCRLHVRDQNGNDIFVMPFPWALGRRKHFVSFWKRSDALRFDFPA